MRLVISIYFLFLLSGYGIAQTLDNKELAALKLKYPNENVVFKNYKVNIEITRKKGNFEITSRHYSEMAMLNENANFYAKNRVYFSDLVRLQSLAAYTLTPQGRKMKKTEVDKFTESYSNTSVFYDDDRMKEYVFPKLTEGSLAVEDYTTVTNDPHFLSTFFTQEFVPSDYMEFSIICDKEIDLGVTIYPDKPTNLSFETHIKGDSRYYTWKGNNCDKIETGVSAPSYSYYVSHIIPYIKSYKSDKENIAIASDIHDLYRWYYSFISRDTTSSKTLKGFTDSLFSARNMTDDQKAREIYYWVQGNIRYVAFEEGYGGYIPHPSAEVFQKRYGDCKDMANLLYQLLKSAGIKASFTWIGTRDIPYNMNLVLTNRLFNHAIVAYPRNGKYNFLDPTNDYLSFDLPPSSSIGKDALISLSADSFDIQTIPIPTKEISRQQDSLWLSIRDNKVRVRGKLKLTGYPKKDLVDVLQKGQERLIFEQMQSYLQRGNNKCTLLDYNNKFVENKDQATEITYGLEIPDYLINANKEIYLNLHLNKRWPTTLIDTVQRTIPFETDYYQTLSDVVTFTIPEAYKLEYLPANDSFESEQFGYNIVYEVLDNTVRLTRNYYYNYLILYPRDFKQWNTMTKRLNQAVNESIILKLK